MLQTPSLSINISSKYWRLTTVVKNMQKTIVKENLCEIFFQFLTEIFSQQLCGDWDGNGRGWDALKIGIFTVRTWVYTL
jgi:hypothetical protein